MNWHCGEVLGARTLIVTPAFGVPLHFTLAQDGAWQAGDVMLFPADGPVQRNPIDLVRELIAATGFPSSVSQQARSELKASLTLLARRHGQLSKGVMALAEEQLPGPGRDMLEELANSLNNVDAAAPEQVQSSNWEVILAHYTRRLPE